MDIKKIENGLALVSKEMTLYILKENDNFAFGTIPFSKNDVITRFIINSSQDSEVYSIFEGFINKMIRCYYLYQYNSICKIPTCGVPICDKSIFDNRFEIITYTNNEFLNIGYFDWNDGQKIIKFDIIVNPLFRGEIKDNKVILRADIDFAVHGGHQYLSCFKNLFDDLNNLVLDREKPKQKIKI